MGARSLTSLLVILCFPIFSVALQPLLWFKRHQNAAPDHRFKHKAVQLLKYRHAQPDDVAIPGAIGTPLAAITTLIPSPGATPTPVYSQSAVLTSYIPIYTLCPLSSASLRGPPYLNNSDQAPAPTTTSQIRTET